MPRSGPNCAAFVNSLFLPSRSNQSWPHALLCNYQNLRSRRLVMSAPSTVSTQNVPSDAFYTEYHGHLVSHLKTVHVALADRPIIFLAGDSTLDNKFYLPSSSLPAKNGYEKVLTPPTSRGDVAHWLNARAASEAARWAALNCAVEESTLAPRAAGALLAQDVFIRDHITARDVLVVCVGGNDVALAPTLATVLNMVCAVWLNGRGGAPVRADGWGMRHFTRGMFRTDMERYIAALTRVTKPRTVVVCMLYHPCVRRGAERGWADSVLRLLGYDGAPRRLQRVIEGIYEEGVRKVEVDGVEKVLPIALYDVMDGTDEKLYEARVEPSEKGANAIAGLLSRKLHEAEVLRAR
jgi:hypothetical protein